MSSNRSGSEVSEYYGDILEHYLYTSLARSIIPYTSLKFSKTCLNFFFYRLSKMKGEKKFRIDSFNFTA